MPRCAEKAGTGMCGAGNRCSRADKGISVITHINVAVMYVADQQRSVDFYVDKLGFTKTVDAEMWPGARWVEVKPPNGQTSITLHSAEAFDKKPGEGAYLTFACDDIDETVRQLRALGVTVTDPVEESWGTYIKATDPDGHEVMISKK
ncbi:VOC family protein [Nonomuraea angiospora]|uniref:VOC family protein n=1 Tax=Nonomuraea angiospora TaxID=46172 RepID=UPI0033C785A5